MARPLSTMTMVTLALSMPGCVTETIDRGSSRFLLPERETAAGSDAGDSGASFSWNSIGLVEYDDFSIPLLSPDGSRFAIRSGAAPGWEEILAEPGSTPVPVATFSIHQIDEKAGLRLQREIRGSWILGRSADETGFLVEEPLGDGSRRIGRVDWDSGDVSWLIDDGDVAAFASIGTDGTIAYSRRDIEDASFELVVRLGDGSGTWVIPSEWGRSWVDPVLAPDGRTLFALCRGDGTVELAWTRITDESRFRDGINTHPISVRTSPRRVHAMLAPQANDASPPGSEARIVFLHPDLARLVEWSPGRDLARPFPDGTINATMLDQDSAISATRDGIRLVRLADGIGRPPSSIPLSEETAIPRRLPANPGDRRFILFRPDAGRYQVIVGELAEESTDLP